MGWAIKRKSDGHAVEYRGNEIPPHDPETEELVECESLDAVKPPDQLANEAAPLECSPLQAKIALHRAGFLDAVEQAVQAAGTEAVLSWRNATVFRRKSPLLIALCEMVPGLKDALPSIITAAVEIEV